jgi:CheY-like chemotaxis protein
MTSKILIVEDDPELHELYTAMLEELDCEVIRAYDGAEALEKLEEVVPDLIVLDILLDEVMGDAFFMSLKAEPQTADIPVVIASVLPSERCKALLELDPRTVYLQKPFRKDRLLQALRRGLE